MKNKIAIRLAVFFAAALLLFSILIGSVFFTLFKTYSFNVHKSDLQKRAEEIAATLSDYMSRPGMMKGGSGGYGAYLRFLNDIAMADVWIVDQNLQLMIRGKMAGQFNFEDLPAGAETVVDEVFKGSTTFSEGFSGLLNTPTITVGTPIYYNDTIIGALLLHSPVEGMNDSIRQGFGILILSVSSALILSILLSIPLAYAFSNPLNKIKATAIQLVGGNYRAKTGVRQKDEIGELAGVLDILSERLDEASRESEKLEQLRRNFVSNISHELRTPVTVIRGSLEALHDKVVTDPVQVADYHSQMLNESIHLQRLVDDLLDLSRLQNTDFQMDMQELNLPDVLSDVIRSARQLSQHRNIAIEQQLDTPVCIITGDYGRLRQMFLIVLDNAIKFSPEAGVITVSLIEKTITIQDRGIGIPAEDLPFIFDRFHKGKSEKNISGTGLGLAIAKQIADRHHIRVSVSSNAESGTEFGFHF